ncbi:hypothetical protein A2208_00335 [Candidatus Woesebacteria bacterium RIFOXYA1_FULL_43_16]|nr:MAG: hypothetical protein A2208_00335 [Candidatus Woesebacteria bacterium RIFOXYA1_FULL_43_16]
MKWKYLVPLFLIVVVYFLFRLGWPDTIEFGYDQPLLSSSVLNFINHPTFLNSFRYVSFNPWGYPSWGATQIFFWVPFLLITKDPIFISQLVVIFNLVGILTIFLIGKKFFSTTIGLVACLILAVHPWSIIFSRMIYEPTPVITLVAISMFLSFSVLENPKSWYISFLVTSWVFLFQVYVHTFSFILPSLALLIMNIRKISKKFLLIGIIFSVLLFLPAFNFFSEQSTGLSGLIKVSNKFIELRQVNPYGFGNIFYEFLGTLGGGRFRWQLGYGYDDFVKDFPFANTAESYEVITVLFLGLYHLVKLFIDKKIRVKRAFLFLWMIGPLWFLTLVKTPIALPRYFLLSLPAFSLLTAIFIEEMSDALKSLKPIMFFLPILVSGFWLILIVNYYNFIGSFNYPSGFLSSYSDVPYSFLKKSFDWVKSDAARKNFDGFIISNDTNYPLEIRLNTAQGYYWDNMLSNNFATGKIGHYLMYFSPLPKDVNTPIGQFGPYVVYEYLGSEVKN